MKHVTLIVLASFIVARGSAQHPTSVFVEPYRNYYAKTDFTKTDSLKCWSYSLTMLSGTGKDSVRPIAELRFQRTLNNHGLKPGITFYVFDLKDSAYCFDKATLSKIVSSCIGLNVGGDIIIFGKFVFLNMSSCVACSSAENPVDFCRPTINRLFLNVR